MTQDAVALPYSFGLGTRATAALPCGSSLGTLRLCLTVFGLGTPWAAAAAPCGFSIGTLRLCLTVLASARLGPLRLRLVVLGPLRPPTLNPLSQKGQQQPPPEHLAYAGAKNASTKMASSKPPPTAQNHAAYASAESASTSNCQQQPPPPAPEIQPSPTALNTSPPKTGSSKPPRAAATLDISPALNPSLLKTASSNRCWQHQNTPPLAVLNIPNRPAVTTVDRRQHQLTPPRRLNQK